MNREPVEKSIQICDDSNRLRCQTNHDTTGGGVYMNVSEENWLSLEKFTRYFLFILPLKDAY